MKVKLAAPAKAAPNVVLGSVIYSEFAFVSSIYCPLKIGVFIAVP